MVPTVAAWADTADRNRYKQRYRQIEETLPWKGVLPM